MTEEVRFIESTGKDVESAVAAGLAKLGLRRNEVIVEILEEGSRGFLGLGGRQSTVRITPVVRGDNQVEASRPRRRSESRSDAAGASAAPPNRGERKPRERRDRESRGDRQARGNRPGRGERSKSRGRGGRSQGAPRAVVERPTVPVEPEIPLTEEEIQTVVGIVEKLLAKMETSATVNAAYSEPDELTGRAILLLSVDGDELGALIGPRGDSLNAMQYLVRLMAGHALQRRINVALDIGGYRERRRLALARLAERMEKKVLSKHRPVTLEPMTPFERRIIHMTLRESSQVYTGSVGEGDRRRVRIYPKR